MEKQTKHRILGLVVIIALFIILLPFFQGIKEIPGENTLITSPPFPDKPADVSADATTTTELKLPEEKIKPQDDSQLPNTDKAKISRYRIIETTELAPKEDAMLTLSSAAWVVQIGSFKNKIHALQLVNNLRANGYHAFVQDISMPDESTRVYVGPEQNHANALVLADRLQNHMHIKGVIMSYKPLTL